MRTEDGIIIQSCLDGKSEAFGVLVDKYRAGIYAYVYSELRDFHEAQDVTQEIFLKAYCGLPDLRRWESFGFWLYRIAYRLCMQWQRSRSRRVDQEYLADQDASLMDDRSLDSHNGHQLSQSVQEALDSLPRKYSEVLILRYFGGLTSDEIANFLGASPTAIRKRLSRARARLKEDIAAMVPKAFGEQRLQAGFTFQIVEMVKGIKLRPTIRTTAIPLASTGLAIALLCTLIGAGSIIPAYNLLEAHRLGKTAISEASESSVPVSLVPKSPATYNQKSPNSQEGNENGNSDLLGRFEQANLTAGDGSPGDSFGQSVSISGDYAFVGAYYSDDHGYRSGAAYTYYHDGESWREVGKLLPDNESAKGIFGQSVSVSGKYAIVSACGDSYASLPGQVYFYKLDGTSWKLQAKVEADDKTPEDFFGFSVYMSEDFAIVGAPRNDSAGPDCGAAYIFRRNGDYWEQPVRLIANDAAANDDFGVSVWVSGDSAIIGASCTDKRHSENGSAYIFRYDGKNWAEEAKLSASDGTPGDEFGNSVSISDDFAIIGARYDDEHGQKSGSTYIFHNNGSHWEEQCKINPDDEMPGDEVGYSVAISGDRAFIGSKYADALYIYQYINGSWLQKDKIVDNHGFGHAIGVSENRVIMGIPYDDKNGVDSGSARIYSLKPTDIVTDNKPSLEITEVSKLD